ncbi:uncharacterized protein [Paramormyrops kingsleyae]|uniref:uncharacterized protein isoform X6 n=1 Tax=Paramormyrops kingsleyae TaxID=1676925 RepID=UPI003B97984C
MTAQFQCYIALRHTCRCCPQELRRRMTVVKYILVRLLFTIEYAAMGVSAVLTAVNSGTADNVTLSFVPVTNLMPGSNMTLQCLLYTYHNPGQCNNHQSNSLTLRWVSDTDTDLQGDPRYQIHTSSCNSTLTTELQWTDNNRKWGCQLTDKGEVKVSQSYTITFPGNNLTSMQPLTAIPVTHSPFSTTVKQPTTNVIAGIMSGVAVFAAVCVAVVVLVIVRRRTGNKNETNQDKAPDSVTYAVIIHPSSQQKEKQTPAIDSSTEYATIRTVN